MVGPHYRLQRWAVRRRVIGSHGDTHGGNLEVIADPGQHVEAFLLGDLFGR